MMVLQRRGLNVSMAMLQNLVVAQCATPWMRAAAEKN